MNHEVVTNAGQTLPCQTRVQDGEPCHVLIPDSLKILKAFVGLEVQAFISDGGYVVIDPEEETIPDTFSARLNGLLLEVEEEHVVIDVVSGSWQVNKLIDLPKGPMTLQFPKPKFPAGPTKRHQLDSLTVGGQSFRFENTTQEVAALPEEARVPKEPTETPVSVLREQILERVRGLGFRFETLDYPSQRFSRNSRWIGRGVRPQDWFFDQIDDRRVAEDAATLKGTQVIIESVQKPNYSDGRQMYYDGNDPLGPILEKLRQEGKIQTPRQCRNIPQDSRFGVSSIEIEAYVIPAFAELIGVDQSQVSLPRGIEFNYAGNVYHPEWGETNTSEWLTDRLGRDFRFFGGNSGHGGLAFIRPFVRFFPSPDIGFRLQVSFSER